MTSLVEGTKLKTRETKYVFVSNSNEIFFKLQLIQSPVLHLTELFLKSASSLPQILPGNRPLTAFGKEGPAQKVALKSMEQKIESWAIRPFNSSCAGGQPLSVSCQRREMNVTAAALNLTHAKATQEWRKGLPIGGEGCGGGRFRCSFVLSDVM